MNLIDRIESKIKKYSDALDVIRDEMRNSERRVIARKILKSITKRKRKRRHGNKGFKYNGTHWMQRPENRERVIKMNRARWRKEARKKS